MNKQDAAEYLGVSVRALERYTQQGKISASYVKGKTRPTVDYNEDELRRFKTELEASLYPKRPVVENAIPPNSPPPSTALARLADMPAGVERLIEIMNMLRAHQQPSVATENKMLLKLPEAAALTGLSRHTLREAIEKKKLKAQIIGRAWRIKRTDLEAYISKL
jgi:excisionase family DNA binding protein